MATSTIITVKYTNYSENVIVNEANAQEVRNLINNDSDVQGWEVATQGDYNFQLVTRIENTQKLRVVNSNDKDAYKSWNGEQNEVKYWSIGLEATCENAEALVDGFWAFIQDNMNTFFYYDSVSYVACPAYDDEGWYSDSFAISATFTTKGAFVKNFRAAVKAFKQANKK